jgi:hypothetical protein
MGLDYRVTQGGLILAQETMDGAALEAALKSRDPDLRLQAWPTDTFGTYIWKVVRMVGEDRPPETICCWMRDGKPLPLSSGLLDLVDSLDRNTRGEHVDADELNRRRREDVDRHKQAAYEDLAADWNPTRGRPIPHKGPALARGRRAMREKGWNV